MINFINSNSGEVTNVPPLLELFPGIGSFTLLLPTGYEFPPFLEWILQASTSSDGISYGDWTLVTVIQGQEDFYNHLNINPRLFYQYRYRIRTLADGVSTWSGLIRGGRPKVLVVDQGHTTTYTFTIGEYDTT